LKGILESITHYSKELEKTKKIAAILPEVNELIELKNNIQSKRKGILSLGSLMTAIKATGEGEETLRRRLLPILKITEMRKLAEDIQEKSTEAKNLKYLLIDINKQEAFTQKREEDWKHADELFEETLEEGGYCPLCGSVIEGAEGRR
jgi:hypothetical protein